MGLGIPPPQCILGSVSLRIILKILICDKSGSNKVIGFTNGIIWSNLDKALSTLSQSTIFKIMVKLDLGFVWPIARNTCNKT